MPSKDRISQRNRHLDADQALSQVWAHDSETLRIYDQIVPEVPPNYSWPFGAHDRR